MTKNTFAKAVLSVLIVVSQAMAQPADTQYVTDWVSSSEFQAIFDKLVDNRYYTHHVEGRVSGGAIQYRGEFRPVFKNLKKWYSFHGMSDEWYERRRAGFETVGYHELYHTYFVDLSGQRVHQACWLELFEPYEPVQPSQKSPKKGTSF